MMNEKLEIDFNMYLLTDSGSNMVQDEHWTSYRNFIINDRPKLCFFL